MSEEQKTHVPRLAVLGLCDAVHRERNVDSRLSQINILHLRSDVVSFIYPLPLRGFHIVVALYDPTRLDGGELVCISSEGQELFKISMAFEPIPKAETPPPPGKLTELRTDPIVPWIISSISWPEVYPLQLQPGSLTFRWRESNSAESHLVGGLNFFHAEAEALTPERIAAIKSDPLAPKKILMRLFCLRCDDTLRIYAGLERSSQEESEGHIWYKDLPESYRCRCGVNHFSLLYLRDNLHALLGHRFRTVGEEITFTQVYEQSGLQIVHDQFRQLLETSPAEEAVQKFFEANTVLLHQFAPEKIFPKAPILTKFKTDFVVLSKSGQLFVVELEAPSKRLLRRNGGRSAEFTQACDQVLNWQHEMRDHRIAVLDSLGIDRNQVSKVTGVVIIGRDEGHERGELMRLKSADLGGVQFYTYDDLLASLGSLIRGIGQL